MGQIVKKNSKRKYGLKPGFTPKLYSEPTEEATIPLVQHDGSIRYATDEAIKWMVDNGLIEMPKPAES